MPDLPIAPARVWIVLSPSGGIVHAQPHEPHPADARMWASHGATVAEYVPKEDARRCDGCRHSKPLQEESDVFCHLWRIRQNPGGNCNEWAAKR